MAFVQQCNFVWKGAGSITATTTAFSSPQGNFFAGNTGNNITVSGAGPAGADLVTTCAANVSGTAETLTATASTTVAGAANWAIGAGGTASSTTGVFTPALAVSSGDLLFVGIDTDPGVTVTGVTDSHGNKWVSCGAGITNGDFFQQGWVCKNGRDSAAAANTITVAFSGTPGSDTTSVQYLQFGASPGGWAQDQFATGNGTSGTPATGTFTTKVPNEVIIGFTGVDDVVTVGGTGYTVEPTPTQQQGALGDQFGDVGQFKFVTTIQSAITVSVTQASNTTFLITAVTFFMLPIDPIGYATVA